MRVSSVPLLLAVILALLPAAGARARTLHLGYQRYGTMVLLKGRGTLEQALRPLGWDVAWSLFPSGPPLLEAMNAGAIDAGMTGETPPIFAEAADVPLVYLAAEPPAAGGEAIVVPRASPIADLRGLRGRRIGFTRGANVHYLLLAALAASGLSWSDVTPVPLAPADGPAALASGAVDALATWDPYLSSVQLATGARVLRDAGGLAPDRQFLLASRALATRDPRIAGLLLAALVDTDAWAASHRDAAAAILQGSSGLPLAVVRRAVARLPFAIRPIDAATVADQQRIADRLAAAGLMPDRVAVAADVVALPPTPPTPPPPR